MTTRERILHLLKEHRGAYLSGEELARSLQISRCAVWKAVRSLREAGFEIDAVTGAGYCLRHMPDLLTADEIVPLLHGHAREYAPLLHIYGSLESTNQTAKALALAGAPHGTAVLAETQTGGRGHGRRSFFSPPGGLYLSVIVHPEVLRLPQTAAVTALAADAVCQTVAQVTGKTPQAGSLNDISLDGRKICGILTEGITDLESGNVSWAVIGIGLHIGVREEVFPPELRGKAGSLYPDGAAEGMRARLAAGILNRLLA